MQYKTTPKYSSTYKNNFPRDRGGFIKGL